MKSRITFLLLTFLLITGSLFAQNSNVGIGTTSPSPKAILELASNSKGFLFPRMTYADRTGITSIPLGLMVYQTDGVGTSQAGIYFYDGMLWKRVARSDEISGGGSSGWTISGNDVYSNVSGNVGIGIQAPTSKFHLVGNAQIDNGALSLNNTNATLQLQNAGVNRAFFQLSGNNLRLGTFSANSAASVIIRMGGSDRMTIDSTGSLGLGTSSINPAVKLDVTSTTRGVLFPRMTVSNIFAISNPPDGLLVYNTDYNQLYQYDGSSWRGMLNSTFWSRPIANRDRIVNTADSIGIGTSGPLAKLHITNGTFADYNGHNGYITLGSTSGLNMVLGNYEILARDNGAEAPLYLQHDGGTVRLGSGTVAAGTKLHITGGTNVASLATHGEVVIGPYTSENIVFDINNIQGRNNGASNRLKLQEFGGPLQLGSGAESPYPDTKLYIPDADEVSLTDDGMILMGRKDGYNIVMDENEIVARNNSNAATLYLQNYGGNVNIGGHTTMDHGGSGEVLRIDGTNPNIGFYQNGTYYSFISQTGSELFLGVNNGKMHLDAQQIAIGNVNNNASAYKLSVSGKVICEELKVELYGTWPDYVFADNYQLKPLHELKSFISANHHLPNIPKASEVENTGFEVGEMNRKLLEKVEELTLYIIDLQEQIDGLKGSKQ